MKCDHCGWNDLLRFGEMKATADVRMTRSNPWLCVRSLRSEAAGLSKTEENLCFRVAPCKVRRQRGDGLSVLLQVHRLWRPAARGTAPPAPRD